MRYLRWHPLCLPVKPPPVVSRQDGVCASSLEAADQRLQAADGASDQLGAAERRQAAAALQVVLLDEVVDARGRVAVGHIESTACGGQTACIGFYILISAAAGRRFRPLRSDL